jgi:hypothetical protein
MRFKHDDCELKINQHQMTTNEKLQADVTFQAYHVFIVNGHAKNKSYNNYI